MFGISFTEILFLLLIVLIVYGPERLPEVARSLGKFLGVIKKNTDSVRRDFYNAVYTPLQNTEGKLKLHERNLTTIASDLMKSDNCETKSKIESENIEKKKKPKVNLDE